MTPRADETYVVHTPLRDAPPHCFLIVGECFVSLDVNLVAELSLCSQREASPPFLEAVAGE